MEGVKELCFALMVLGYVWCGRGRADAAFRRSLPFLGDLFIPHQILRFQNLLAFYSSSLVRLHLSPYPPTAPYCKQLLGK